MEADDIMDFFYNEVLIDKPVGFKEASEVIHAIKKEFKIEGDEFVRLFKNAGKVGRGCNIPEYKDLAIEFNILTGFNGAITYTELQNMRMQDVIFFLKMLHERDKEKKEK